MAKHECRHSLALSDDGLELIIGWDAPMQTYFLQVGYDVENCDTPELLLWAGSDIGELPAVEHAEAAYEEWAASHLAAPPQLPIDDVLKAHLLEAQEVKPSAQHVVLWLK